MPRRQQFELCQTIVSIVSHSIDSIRSKMHNPWLETPLQSRAARGRPFDLPVEWGLFSISQQPGPHA
jgi:hypothetical protein